MGLISILLIATGFSCGGVFAALFVVYIVLYTNAKSEIEDLKADVYKCEHQYDTTTTTTTTTQGALKTHYAKAIITEANGSGITGEVRFFQTEGQDAYMYVDVEGLLAGEHGFHIHENGLISNDCADAGGHYNPWSESHGRPTDTVRHVGDLGNIVADSTGKVFKKIVDNRIMLYDSLTAPTNLQANVMNLAIMFHALPDDFTGASGNAGSRLGCGKIVATDSSEYVVKADLVKAINSGVTGQVLMYQAHAMSDTASSTPTTVIVDAQGLSKGDHGFHVHEFGKITNDCKDAGGHLNPYADAHGAPTDTVRHVGDLGNVTADDKGTVFAKLIDERVNLYVATDEVAKKQANVQGKAIMFHAKADNFEGASGNAGDRVACGLLESMSSASP